MAYTSPPAPVQVPVYYSAAQLGAGALLGGWAQSQLETVIAIALAESGGQANAVGPEVRGVGRAYGVMQIMYPLHSQLFSGGIESGRWMDCATNMQMAHAIYASQGWGAWETYTNGRYRLFAGQAQAAAAGLNNAIAGAGGNASNVASTTLQGAQGRVVQAQQAWAHATGGTAAPAAVNAVLTNPGTSTVDPAATQIDLPQGPTTTGAQSPIVRVFEVVLGSFLVVVGAYMFTRPVTTPAIQAAKDVVGSAPVKLARKAVAKSRKKPAPAPQKPAPKRRAPVRKKSKRVPHPNTPSKEKS